MVGDDDSSPSTTGAPAPTEPPMAVTAKALAADYEDNEVSADQKYKGRMLEVSGKVVSIDSGISDKAIVQLIGKNEFLHVLAQGGDEFTKYAGTLKKDRILF